MIAYWITSLSFLATSVYAMTSWKQALFFLFLFICVWESHGWHRVLTPGFEFRDHSWWYLQDLIILGSSRWTDIGYMQNKLLNPILPLALSRIFILPLTLFLFHIYIFMWSLVPHVTHPSPAGNNPQALSWADLPNTIKHDQNSLPNILSFFKSLFKGHAFKGP